MRLSQLLIILITVASCGGGGGSGGASIPFALTLAQNTFSTNEDTAYTGSVAANANEIVTLEYSLTSSTSNGNLTFSSNASITYTPNANYFGQDEFTYSVTAVEKNITRTSTVTISISAVNDSPLISMSEKTDLDKNHILFESNPKYSITFSDIDNEEADLVFSVKVNDNDIPSTFVSSGDGAGEITLDLSNLPSAGYFRTQILVSDGDLSSEDSFSTWFIADRQTVTVAMDDDKSDGFDEGSTTNKDYYVYYLVGGGSTFGRTDYLFVADSIEEDPSDGTIPDIDSFREALLKSINALNLSLIHI